MDVHDLLGIAPSKIEILRPALSYEKVSKFEQWLFSEQTREASRPSHYLNKNWDGLLTLADSGMDFIKTFSLESDAVFIQFRSLAIYKPFYWVRIPSDSLSPNLRF